MNAVIETRALTKTYGTVRALDGLTLTIPRGGVYGILGPNGAGKSTLFRILLGLVRPGDGTATVMGGAIGDIAAMRRMGSMLQRLGVAAALMSKPDLVILDEPTSGMDPPGIQEMRALIRSLADDDDVTVVLASHQLLEVQKVCDRVAILNRGKLILEGAVSELTAAGGERLRLSLSPVEAALAVLGERGSRDDDGVMAAITRDEAPALIRALVEQGVAITEARWIGADLESIFMTETGAAEASRGELTHAG